MKNFLRYSSLTLLFGILFCCLGYLIVGEIKRSPNVIIKQNSEYLWVKKYSPYNKDSCVYKYHQPIIYEGIVVNRRRNFVGVPRKVAIQYTGQTFIIIEMKNIQKQVGHITILIKKVIK